MSGDDYEIDPATLAVLRAGTRRDVATARLLGEQIGFGALMQATEIAWREHLAERGWPTGGEFAYGPCVALLVPCPARTLDDDGNEQHYLCDWCCGTGRVTKRVAQAIAAAGDATKQAAEQAAAGEGERTQ